MEPTIPIATAAIILYLVGMLGAMLIIFLVEAQDNIGPFRPEFYLLFVLCWPYVIFEIIRTGLENEEDE